MKTYYYERTVMPTWDIKDAYQDGGFLVETELGFIRCEDYDAVGIFDTVEEFVTHMQKAHLFTFDIVEL